MSIRYFEVFQESDREDETEHYLCTNRSDAINIANRDWWGMSANRRENLDYFCLEAYEVDDDFGECLSETVVRTWKPSGEADYSDLSSKAVMQELVNIANGYEDEEYSTFEAEAKSENFCNAATDEVKELIQKAWNKSRAGE